MGSACWSRTQLTGSQGFVLTTQALRHISLRDSTWAPPTTKTSSMARTIRIGLVSTRAWDLWRLPSEGKECQGPMTCQDWAPVPPSTNQITGCTDSLSEPLTCCHSVEQSWSIASLPSRARRSRRSPPRRCWSSAFQNSLCQGKCPMCPIMSPAGASA